MDDTISRQDAIDAVIRAEKKGLQGTYYLGVVPSAQPERKKGEWITNYYAFGEDRYECDQCHNTALHRYDFCPNCGSDMRGEQDEPEK